MRRIAFAKALPRSDLPFDIKAQPVHILFICKSTYNYCVLRPICGRKVNSFGRASNSSSCSIILFMARRRMGLRACLIIIEKRRSVSLGPGDLHININNIHYNNRVIPGSMADMAATLRANKLDRRIF